MPIPEWSVVAHNAWTGFVTLGGLAFVKQITDWLRRRPKLIGEIEGIAIGNATFPDGKGAALLMSLYMVNARLEPTTIRGWELVASKNGQKWTGQRHVIPSDFNWSGIDNIDWKTATRIYDQAASNLLEYRKGIRGWILFVLLNTDVVMVKDGALLELTAIDALMGRHKITLVTGKREVTKIPYFPGLGVKT